LRQRFFYACAVARFALIVNRLCHRSFDWPSSIKYLNLLRAWPISLGMQIKLSVISRFCLLLSLIALAVLPPQVASAAVAGLDLASPLMTAVNRVLSAGDKLHKSLIVQNEDEIEIGIRDMIWHIDQARQASAYAKPHERGHLLLILDAAREQFELTQSAYGEERRVSMEAGYNQLANLVRIYQVDRSYGIFFCPDDKSSWVQKGLKGQNPFHPKGLLNCGMRVVNR
jgi:hypothetical protein